jgi:LL-diaminopimelate aminotransferase
MTKRNSHLYNLQDSYLFPKVRKFKEQLLEANPQAKIISLSIGDTTEPIPPKIVDGLTKMSQQLGTAEGYFGYGPETGINELRSKIAEVIYPNLIDKDEIFVSDGAKCDISRLQLLFGKKNTVAIQDPAYPVYVDTSLIIGHENIVYMPCHENNNFFPDLKLVPKTDLIFFCSPNNPTGATANKEQLKQLVDFAKANHSIIIFDAAYNLFIQDPTLPKSIYEIDGADEVAIEVGSFSKLVGFTGVRLSWTVVPKKLRYECGSLVHKDWLRIQSTCFNGASIISQKGGIAALSEQGQIEMKGLINFYMENAHILKTCLESRGFKVYGGENIPFLWVKQKNLNSWDAFGNLLNNYHIVTTPGSGFGPSGEGYLRFSTFLHRQDLMQAVDRLSKL